MKCYLLIAQLLSDDRQVPLGVYDSFESVENFLNTSMPVMHEASVRAQKENYEINPAPETLMIIETEINHFEVATIYEVTYDISKDRYCIVH